MITLDPKIQLQEDIAKQIYSVLQGSVINKIREKCEGTGLGANLKSVMEGNSLKVSETLLPEFYAICEGIKEKLGCSEKIDFYITGSNEVNARAFYSDDPECPHIIEINSGLFNLMNGEELKYVIGHEIGHLINGDSSLKMLYYFIYPTQADQERVPAFLQKRMDLYDQLAELSADRYGYIANENLEACITAIFKMASGLYLDKMNFSIQTLIYENSQRLDFFLNQNGVSEGSHPVNPIRIRAIEVYANAKTPVGLTKGMNPLIDVINGFVYNKREHLIADFLAATGLLVAQLDGRQDKNEEEFILKMMGQYCLYPQRVLKQIAKENVQTVMEETFAKLMEMAPFLREQVLLYVIDVAFGDGEITDEEVGFIFAIGDVLHFSEDEIAGCLRRKIQNDFTPKASSLKI